MDYAKIIEYISKKIPNGVVLNRQDLLDKSMEINPLFQETLLRNLLEKLLKEGVLVRVGRNQYKKYNGSVNKEIYKSQYSNEALFLIEIMEREYPLLDYRVWELNWLNEFWNHQIAQNKIFLEVERIGCNFVYTGISDKYSGRILLTPNEKELYRYGGPDTVIIDRLISEAPKGSPEHYNAPLEKVIVDLFANKNLRSMVHIGEYAEAVTEMFNKYIIDQTKLFRYANRRNKKKEIYHFLKEEAGIEVTAEV